MKFKRLKWYWGPVFFIGGGFALSYVVSEVLGQNWNYAKYDAPANPDAPEVKTGEEIVQEMKEAIESGELEDRKMYPGGSKVFWEEQLEARKSNPAVFIVESGVVKVGAPYMPSEPAPEKRTAERDADKRDLLRHAAIIPDFRFKRSLS